MKRRMISVLLALVMVLCVGIPAAGAITEDDMTNAPELVMWQETPATLTTGGGYVYFKILPELTCTYTVYSTGSIDTKGYLYDAAGNQIAYNDDGGTGYNFEITQELTGGETYYLGITIFNSGTGSFSVILDGHDVAEWTTVTEPTCTAPGQQTGTCSLCNNTITRVIPPLGHDWGAATSNNNGTHTHTCNRCHVTETEDCTYEDQSEGGFTKHTCTVCGYSYTEEVSGEQQVAHWGFEKEPTDWTFIDADGDSNNWEWTENSDAYEGTHTIRSYSDKGGALTPDNWAISPAFSLAKVTDPMVSLWASGRRNSSWCNEVFAIYAGITPIPEQMTKISDDITTGNTFVNYTADLSDFTGEATVYIAIRHYNCTYQYWLDIDCVEILGEMAACSEHVLVAVPAAAATCTLGGHSAYWQCKNCGRCFYDAAGTQPALPSDLITSPALGHDWGNWTETTPATCTASGIETAHCSRCDATITREIEALGHDWGTAVSNNDGTHTYTCSRCHETDTEDCNFETHMENGVVNDICTECGYSVINTNVIAYWDFEEEPYDWWFLDGDGDGYNWEWNYGRNWHYHGGNGMLQSASWYGSYALEPDNFAVSPAFSLVDCTDATLSVWARGQDTTYYDEVFAFYAGTTRNPNDWVKVSEDYTSTGEYEEYTADLSEFIGEPVVHIVVRHYDVTDMFWLNIDDVSIVGTRPDPCETGHHHMTYVPAKEPTETEDGNIAYYICDVCGYYYLDEAGTKPVSAADVILPSGYPIVVDDGIENGTVVTLVTRAKEGELVPLYVRPYWGAMLEYLAYIDDTGEKTVFQTSPQLKESIPQRITQEPDIKLAQYSRADAFAGLTRDEAPANVKRSETELTENYFDMPASSVTVTATFGPKYTITLDPGEAGGDPVVITSLDDGVWADNSSSAENGQFFTYSGSDAFYVPDNPFIWNNHTFANWKVDGYDEVLDPGQGLYAFNVKLIAQWTTDELADGYYLIGPDWTFEAIDADEIFEVNPANENEYMLNTELAAGDEIKVVHLTDNVIDAWYPDGLDNQYHVDAAHAGNVNIYFQTSYKDDWSEFGGYFWIEVLTVHVDGYVEWNSEDVQFKGTTAYVIANGSAQTPRFTVKNSADDSVIDPMYYDYEYQENTAAGTGYVIVTFKDNYEGTCLGSFKIYLPATTTTAVENVADGIKITWAPVEGAAGYVIYRRAWSSTTDGWTTFARWDNTTETTYLDGHDASHKVFAGTRYQYGVKAYFARRTDPVSGAEIGGNVNDPSGNFNLGEVGPLKTTVRITTRTLNSVTAGTKQMTVKWTPSSVFTGYEIRYATNKAFTKNVKTVKITNPQTAKKVIKSLTTGKTYYVQIRSYHVFNGMTYYGGWSNTKSCKVK